METKIIYPIEIPQELRNAAWDYAMTKMPEGFNLNNCIQKQKDIFYDHYYLYIISGHTQKKSIGFAEWCSLKGWHVVEVSSDYTKWNNTITHQQTYSPELYQEYLNK